MKRLLTIELGIIKDGWLPVEFFSGDFHLDFSASIILNNPIEEIYNIVTNLNNNEINRITWWLEPNAFIFEFEKKGEIYKLRIIETEHLHVESAKKKQLILISGYEKEVVEPFRIGLRKFASRSFDENNWPFKMEINKIKNL